MQLKLLVLVLLVFSIIACSFSEKRINSDFKKSLSTSDMALLSLAVHLQKEAAKEVWPDFSDFTTSVVYFTQKGQFLLNPKDSIPSEYYMLNFEGPSWSPKVYSTADWFAPDGSKMSQEEVDTAYLANAISKHQADNQFGYSIFYLDSIERFHFKEMNWEVEDWLAIFWHEVFHNYQDVLYSPELVTDEFTNYAHLKEYAKSDTFIKTIKAEMKILTKALETAKINSKRNLLCKKFVPMREKRHKEMSRQAVDAEQFYEISEGTARYVEELMSLAAGRLLSSELMQKRYSMHKFNFFKKYANRNRNYYFDTIQEVSTKKRYVYNTGFGLALLLDQILPSWKTTAFIQKGFLFTQVKNWCQK